MSDSRVRYRSPCGQRARPQCAVPGAPEPVRRDVRIDAPDTAQLGVSRRVLQVPVSPLATASRWPRRRLVSARPIESLSGSVLRSSRHTDVATMMSTFDADTGCLAMAPAECALRIFSAGPRFAQEFGSTSSTMSGRAKGDRCDRPRTARRLPQTQRCGELRVPAGHRLPVPRGSPPSDTKRPRSRPVAPAVQL
jgi:hypothetical protein